MGPLRKFASAKIRYKPTEELRQVFEAAREHLLSPEVGAIQTPSPHLDDDMFIFTDASANAMSAIMTQKQFPNEKREGAKKLYIIGVWSGTLPRTSRTLPILIAELYALYESSLRWASFLICIATFVYPIIVQS